MMQFNLLPDVKINFLKAQRIKRMAMSISFVAMAGAVAILIILLAIVGWQKKSLGDLNSDITRYSVQVRSTPNLNKILTVQNQLNSLPSLDSAKPAASSLSDYVAQLTPSDVTFSDFKLSFTAHNIDVTGLAANLATVDQFVDTLKFANYTVGDSSQSKKVFSDVVLSSFGLSQNQSNSAEASYEVTANFDPTIFSSQKITLKVPPEVTTRSVLDQPLFTGTNNNKGQ